MDRSHFFNASYISPTENKSVINITFYSVNKGLGYAIRDLCRITLFEAVITF